VLFAVALTKIDQQKRELLALRVRNLLRTGVNVSENEVKSLERVYTPARSRVYLADQASEALATLQRPRHVGRMIGDILLSCK